MNRGAATIVVGAIAIAACSGGNDAVQEPDDVAATVTTTMPDASFTQVATTAVERPAFADGPLAEVCPATVVVQLDELPAVEHGPLFALLGPAPTIDAERQVASAPLQRAGGTVEEVVLELRAGGPAIDFRTPLEVIAADETVTLAEVSIADAAAFADTLPVTGVVSLTDISHQMIMWDPVSYPDVMTLEQLAAAGVEIRHVTGEPFIDELVRTGVLEGADLVDGFFGEPAAFVAAGGAIAQQGDALVEPFLFPSLPQWSKPIQFDLAANHGWSSYDDVLVVDAAEVDADLRQCLGRLVPVIQNAMISYSAAPAATNELMASMREAFNPLTRAAPELLDQGAQAALDSAIVGNGADGVIGSFDLDRVAGFVESLELGAAGADELVTNDFVAADRSL